MILSQCGGKCVRSSVTNSIPCQFFRVSNFSENCGMCLSSSVFYLWKISVENSLISFWGASVTSLSTGMQCAACAVCRRQLEQIYTPFGEYNNLNIRDLRKLRVCDLYFLSVTIILGWQAYSKHLRHTSTSKESTVCRWNWKNNCMRVPWMWP